jgi:hypothetical protein
LDHLFNFLLHLHSFIIFFLNFLGHTLSLSNADSVFKFDSTDYQRENY